MTTQDTDLEHELGLAIDFLIWMSGAADFTAGQPGHEVWSTQVQPFILKHTNRAKGMPKPEERAHREREAKCEPSSSAD